MRGVSINNPASLEDEATTDDGEVDTDDILPKLRTGGGTIRSRATVSLARRGLICRCLAAPKHQGSQQTACSEARELPCRTAELACREYE